MLHRQKRELYDQVADMGQENSKTEAPKPPQTNGLATGKSNQVCYDHLFPSMMRSW